MQTLLLTGLAFGCCGALCALLADVHGRIQSGVLGILGLNLFALGRFAVQVASTGDLGLAAGTLAISQTAAAVVYLCTALLIMPETGGEQDAESLDR